MSIATLQLGEISLDVIRKEIKNVHLSVHPPTGRVRIAAPLRMSQDAIRLFAISKVSWIKRHQNKVQSQDRETPREYLDRESHYVWGRRVLLKIIEADDPPLVEHAHTRLVLQIRPDTSIDARESVVSAWYRQQVRLKAEPLIENWQDRLKVHASTLFVQQMKTKWGSCNPTTRTIRINTELAKKPPECLEYIVLHEMLHLLEPTHNTRFISLMDRYMPHWRETRDLLNRLPARHERWTY